MTRRDASALTARARVAISVRRLRLAVGFSQEELAERAGFHRTYLSRVERQVANISVDGLDSLAAVLAVDVATFLADGTSSLDGDPDPQLG